MRQLVSMLFLVALSACVAKPQAPSGPVLPTTKLQREKAEAGQTVALDCEDVVAAGVWLSPAPDYDKTSSDLAEKKVLKLLGNAACTAAPSDQPMPQH